MWKFIKNNWGQIFFAAVGLAFLAFSFFRLFKQDITGASVTFAMAFFSFIYSNISRFKRFKGLGFEAELWEDKQKEAAQLIDRLKAVVSVYTREVVMQKVMQGRWGNGVNWRENWDLYDDLVAKHNELGQTIDFTDLKAKLDRIFIFDMVSQIFQEVRIPAFMKYEEAQHIIGREFRPPNQDTEGLRARANLLGEVPDHLGNLVDMYTDGDSAKKVLEWMDAYEDKLKTHFNIEIEWPEGSVERLKTISALYQAGPIQVTDAWIKLANHR